ncbi:MAG: glycosyltransferase [Planctomycetota bacterium]
MRILHCVHGFLPESVGGTESYVRDLVLAQRDAGHTPHILGGSLEVWPKVGSESTDFEGIPVERVHRSDLYFDSWQKTHCPEVGQLFSAYLETLRPDLVHVHQWIRLTDDLVTRAAKAGVPSVVTLHDLYTSCPRAFRMRDGDEFCERPLSPESCLGCAPQRPWQDEAAVASAITLYDRAYRSELHHARAVLVAGQETADLIAKTTGRPADRLEAIGLAYTPRTGQLRGRKAAVPAPGEPVRLGVWGHINERKGNDLLVEAFAELAQKPGLPPLELHVFGKIDTEQLAAKMQRAAEGANVTFHGRFEWDQILAANLHLAVIPTRCFETWGFVLDEAFELGLPVVVPDIGVIPGRIGGAGVKFRCNDKGDLVNVLERLVTSPEELKRLAAQIPEPTSDLGSHLARVLGAYDRAIAMGPPDLESQDELNELRAAVDFQWKESYFRRHLEREGLDAHIENLERELQHFREEDARKAQHIEWLESRLKD